MRKSRVYIALLHHPMYNKRMDIITTSVTNLDLHDIARAACTYEVETFFVVHPSDKQHHLLEEILSYWQDGYGGQYNPDRKEAFSILKTARTLEEIENTILQEQGRKPLTVSTDARLYPNTISYKKLRQHIYEEDQVYLLLFGTGWGIQKEVMEACDYILEPLEAGREYNHFSVRSAVSIIMDRLLGEYWFKD